MDIFDEAQWSIEVTDNLPTAAARLATVEEAFGVTRPSWALDVWADSMFNDGKTMILWERPLDVWTAHRAAIYNHVHAGNAAPFSLRRTDEASYVADGVWSVVETPAQLSIGSEELSIEEAKRLAAVIFESIALLTPANDA